MSATRIEVSQTAVSRDNSVPSDRRPGGSGCISCFRGAGTDDDVELIIERIIEFFEPEAGRLTLDVFLRIVGSGRAELGVLHRGSLSGALRSFPPWGAHSDRDRIDELTELAVALHADTEPDKIRFSSDGYVTIGAERYQLRDYQDGVTTEIGDEPRNVPFTAWRVGPFPGAGRWAFRLVLEMHSETRKIQLEQDNKFYVYGDSILLDIIDLEDLAPNNDPTHIKYREYLDSILNHGRLVPDTYEFILVAPVDQKLDWRTEPLSPELSESPIDNAQYADRAKWFVVRKDDHGLAKDESLHPDRFVILCERLPEALSKTFAELRALRRCRTESEAQKALDEIAVAFAEHEPALRSETASDVIGEALGDLKLALAPTFWEFRAPSEDIITRTVKIYSRLLTALPTEHSLLSVKHGLEWYQNWHKHPYVTQEVTRFVLPALAGLQHEETSQLCIAFTTFLNQAQRNGATGAKAAATAGYLTLPRIKGPGPSVLRSLLVDSFPVTIASWQSFHIHWQHSARSYIERDTYGLLPDEREFAAALKTKMDAALRETPNGSHGLFSSFIEEVKADQTPQVKRSAGVGASVKKLAPINLDPTDTDQPVRPDASDSRERKSRLIVAALMVLCISGATIVWEWLTATRILGAYNWGMLAVASYAVVAIESISHKTARHEAVMDR